MVHQSIKENRTKNRIVTASARAVRVAKRLTSARTAQATKIASNEIHDKDYQVIQEGNHVEKTGGGKSENQGDQVPSEENHVEKTSGGESENQADQVTEKDKEDELEEGGEKRAWKKRPRTHEWILSKPALGGPLSTELLRGYRGHVACHIWENNIERGCLVIQSRTQAIELFEYQSRAAWYILVKSTGLYHLCHCVFLHHNAPLISAFIERWHPETNSFHLPFGEMTITLHDVSLIMGLHISGKATNHPMLQKENHNSLFKFIADLLHLDMKQVQFEHSHGGIKLSKIRDIFCNDSSENSVTDIAKGYLISLLGSTIFIDKIVDRVSTSLFPLVSDIVSVKSYSWASATLAFLYRELGKASRASCKQLAGSSTLLEAWIYEHFPMFRPV